MEAAIRKRPAPPPEPAPQPAPRAKPPAAAAPARARPKPPERAALPEYESVGFVPSGSTLLDLVLGGGWARGRVVNVVGDKSSGKTLLAIEACANVARMHGAENIRYAEAEAAFDLRYADSIGMPRGIDMTGDLQTVEQFDEDLSSWLEARKPGKDCLYVLDSLDALSDEAEMARDIDKGSFGAAKAKKMSELFRRRIKLIEDRACTLFVISQIRDKMNVTFGETKTRSGGRALDFYSSQVVWLAEIGKIKRTITKVERIVGVNVLAKTKKNKVGPPFREAEMTIQFSYGVDDEISMLNWLKKHDALGGLALSEKECRDAIASCRLHGERDALADIADDLRQAVTKRWMDVEDALKPTMSKYGS